MIYVGIYIVYVSVCTIYFISQNKEENSRLTIMSTAYIVKKRIEASIQKSVRDSKVSELEKLYLQADIPFSLLGHITISTVTSIALGVLSYVFLKNELIFIFAVIYGYSIPKQIMRAIKNSRANKLEDQIITFMQMHNSRFKVMGNMQASFFAVEEDFRKVQPLGKILHDCNLMVQGGMSMEQMLHIFGIKCNSKYAEIYVDFLLNAKDTNSITAKHSLLKKAEKKAVKQRDLKRLQKNKLNANKKGCFILTGTVPVFALVQSTINSDWLPFMTQNAFGKGATTAVFVIVAGCLYLIDKKIATFEG